MILFFSCGNKNNSENIQPKDEFEFGITRNESFLVTRFNQEQENKECLLVAFSEHVANSTYTLKLLENNKFVYRAICFGIKTTKGKYEIKGDSVFFQAKKFYKYGIIEHNPHLKDERYKKDISIFKLYNHNDEMVDCLRIIEDKLSVENDTISIANQNF